MKNIFRCFLLVVLTITMHSCLEGYNDSTPGVQCSIFVHNWTDSVHGDTLRWKRVEEKVVYDTIAVGDSVRFGVLAFSNANSLVSLTFDFDPSLLRMEFTDLDENQNKVKCLDTTKTVLDKGQYYFLPMYNQVLVPIRYYPLASGNPMVKITVTSDANADRVPNTASLEFVQPVR